jgi:hypothetical protein
MHDPISAFESINRALSAEGLLVFETGNIADVRESFYPWFAHFSYPEHLFFFGERSIGILLGRTGFKCLAIWREAIALRLLLEKVLWNSRGHLKEKSPVKDLRLSGHFDSSANRRTSWKRRLRHMYRFAGGYLIRLGAMLPKDGWPSRLVVIARKESELPHRA